MKTIKAIFLAMLLIAMNSAIAATDEEDLEFRGAVADGNIPVVKKYIEGGIMKVNEPYVGWTPLLAATAKNHLNLVKYLASQGGDVNFIHPITKMTALAHAAYNGNNEMVEFLLQKGANPNPKLRHNDTVINLAQEGGHTKTVEILKQHGSKEVVCPEGGCEQQDD